MFAIVPIAALPRVRKALAKLEGYPLRGTVIGGEDFTTDVIGSPGWTVEAVGEVDDDGTTACVEVPDRLLRWCGRTVTIGAQTITLPTLEELVNEDAIPDAIKAIRLARRTARLAMG